ncbi:B12-binding domain-containing radical SAM protein [Planctomycetota bacterium]|nr:B12-binding domain-containing radical SAM protein [Planctomycetota bacterium]
MSSKLDVVVVAPGGKKKIYQGLTDLELVAGEPPLWGGLIANFLRRRGYSVKIVDAGGMGWDPERVAEEVATLDPLLMACFSFGSQPSASTHTMPALRAVCEAIATAAPGVKRVVGGVHVSALPQRTLEEENVDYVCQGEGPHTVAALLDVLREGSSDLSKVPGLWYREGGTVHSTAQAPLIQDLDAELPGVAWDLLPMDRYRAHNWHCFDHIHDRQPYAVLYTSLGCPFKCAFCCINAPFGLPAIRYRSPENVIEEIDVLVNDYGVKNIKIIDEMFVLNGKHVLALCDLIIERGYDLNIWAYARVDTVRDKYLEKLKQAGVNWLALGIESASAHVRDGADKSFGKKDITEVVRKIQDAGIYVIGNYIFGLPDDTHETMQETLDLALDLNCEFANFYSAMAYPGSRLYTQALEQDLALPDSWGGFSQHAYDSQPLPTEALTAGEVLAFRDRAFHAYFESPTYLEMIQRKFGDDVHKHVVDMAKHRLRRKLVEAAV